MRALVALMAGLLAIVAEALGRGTDLSVVADIATFVACATRKGRHRDCVLVCRMYVRRGSMARGC